MRKKLRILIPNWLSITSFCLAVVACLFAVILFVNRNTPHSLDDANSFEETYVQKNPDSIAIPGYEVLEFNAERKTQTLCLSNPPQNVCYFQISLYLGDNTLLWRSELIEPGKTSEPIQLIETLKKGTYTNAILKYDCYKMDGKTPLNGAETKLTLWVK